MSVNLEPAELGFKRPFTQEVSQVLRLSNSQHEPVAFKVKTTAPKQYCVRPNSGRIEPGGEVQVQVLLQAMKEDPPVDARCRDKFLVQSVAIPGNLDVGNVTQIWTSIEQTNKSSIQEKKIRVSWLPADGTLAPATNGIAHHDDEPPVYSPTASAAVTPQRNTAAASRLIPDEKSPALHTSPDTSYSAQPNTAQPSAVDSATAAVASATGISQAELQRKLDSANATIADLRQQAAEGLRQRKIIGDSSTSSTSAKSPSTSLQSAPPAGGVPVHIVAGLCLLVFLIAYLFFWEMYGCVVECSPGYFAHTRGNTTAKG